MIIVIDTNVLVSGLLKMHSIPAAVLHLVLEGKIKIAYDIRIIDEYRDVLKRDKFGFKNEQVEAIIEHIKAEGISVVAGPIASSLPDKDDSPFLEVALAGGVKFLITGNKKHFPQKICKEVEILSPSEFVILYNKLRDRNE